MKTRSRTLVSAICLVLAAPLLTAQVTQPSFVDQRRHIFRFDVDLEALPTAAQQADLAQFLKSL